MGLEERETKRRASVVGMLTSAGAEADVAPKAEIVLQPKKGQTKSQKFLASMPPSLYEKVKKKAGSEGISVNEAVNQLLELWVGQ
ncbi:MAG: type II toxin-antitoxin system HicB family antitoxin [Eubacteriaceae bacterium]|nr:type II toxin-antitoxin system HicB family antitoxin [Eubacteriaceae bacterium]